MEQKMLQNDPNVMGEYFDKCNNRWLVRLEKRRKPIKRSRYIMAKYLCCLKYGLPSCLIVHHKDGNITNDCLENLQLMRHGSHTRLSLLDESKYGVSKTLNPREYNHRYRIAHRDYYRQYYQNNKEHRTEYMRQYYQNNKEQRAEYTRQYYQNHKKQHAEYLRQWRKKRILN